MAFTSRDVGTVSQQRVLRERGVRAILDGAGEEEGYVKEFIYTDSSTRVDKGRINAGAKITKVDIYMPSVISTR